MANFVYLQNKKNRKNPLWQECPVGSILCRQTSFSHLVQNSQKWQYWHSRFFTTVKIINSCRLESNGVYPKSFSLNSVKKNDIKRTRACHPATSCVRDQHATTAPARHSWEIVSLNWAQFMLQWFISFFEFTEFSESSAPFRKNSNACAHELAWHVLVSLKLLDHYVFMLYWF